MFRDSDHGTTDSWRIVAPVVAWSPEGMVSAHLEVLCSETWDAGALRNCPLRSPLPTGGVSRGLRPRSPKHDRL